jgi:hypothetical protein
MPNPKEIEQSGWETYDKTYMPYPAEDDEDVFFRANAPVKDEHSKMNKLLVTTNDRTISVFESQIRPIARYFGEHPDEKAVRVYWVKEGDRILPEIQTKLEG